MQKTVWYAFTTLTFFIGFSNASIASTAPEISFSGSLSYEIIAHDADRQVAGTGLNITANEQQSALSWDAQGEADNGLQYGAAVEWYWAADSSPGYFNAGWLDVQGHFGRLFIGAEDGATDLVASSNSQILQIGSWGTDGENALRHVNFINLNSTLHYFIDHAGNTGTTNKVGYVSPSYAGFELAITYSPEGNSFQAAGVENGSQQQAWEVAASYSGTFNQASYKIDGAYGLAKNRSDVVNATAPIDRADIKAYQIGAMVEFEKVSLAASYGNNGESSCAKNIPTCDAGSFWDIGVGYYAGQWGFSASFQQAEDDIDGNGYADQSEIFHAGTQYSLADGLSVYANFYDLDLSDENNAGQNVATANKANVIIVGSLINF